MERRVSVWSKENVHQLNLGTSVVILAMKLRCVVPNQPCLQIPIVQENSDQPLRNKSHKVSINTRHVSKSLLRIIVFLPLDNYCRKNWWFKIICYFTFCLSQFSIFSDSSCKFENGELGKCVNEEECPKSDTGKICGYFGNTVDVCCPIKSIKNITKEESSEIKDAGTDLGTL